ncbi:MAG: M23 family metallopeptidase [Bacteroidota bacterium]
MSNKHWPLGVLLSLSLLLFTGSRYTETTYRYPMDNHYALSGTFGELRPNHFHSGIDIKAYGKIGIPVRAVDDGYISRLKVSPFGFGNAVYLRHPNGNYSVYAHLDGFTSEVEDYIYRQQYKKRSFAQELFLGSQQFPVNEGDIIGFSGNSGSSLGPHLHFEIRDPDERILNPLQYYKQLVADHKPPIVQEIGIDPLRSDSRIQGEFKKFRTIPSGGNGSYSFGSTIRIRGPVGIEYRAYDLLDAAGNHCGINYAQLYLDGNKIHELDLRKFTFDETRYLNVHIDYGHHKQTKKRLERAYIESGNVFSGYIPSANQGVIELTDDAVHHFRLVLSDEHGNESVISGKLQRDFSSPLFSKGAAYSHSPTVTHTVYRNTLVISAIKPHADFEDGLLVESADGFVSTLPPTYWKDDKLVFLLPLDHTNYPLRIKDQNGLYEQEFFFRDQVVADRNNLIQVDELDLYFPYASLFSDSHIEVIKKAGTRDMYSNIFVVGDERIPVYKSYLVSFTPTKPIPLTHLVVARKTGKEWEYAGNTVGESKNIYTAIRQFGEFCLMADTTAPTIEAVNFRNNGAVSSGQRTLKVKLSDDFSGLEHSELYGTIDGAWALFAYDNKAKTLTLDLRKDRPSPGMHSLIIFARDKARNQAQKQYQIRF